MPAMQNCQLKPRKFFWSNYHSINYRLMYFTNSAGISYRASLPSFSSFILGWNADIPRVLRVFAWIICISGYLDICISGLICIFGVVGQGNQRQFFGHANLFDEFKKSFIFFFRLFYWILFVEPQRGPYGSQADNVRPKPKPEAEALSQRLCSASPSQSLGTPDKGSI